MQVKLISYSTPAAEMINAGVSDAKELVAFCARVSNPNNQLNLATSDALVKYLMKHSHWSPLEMVNVCMEVTTTRDIARQILRHRSFSFQEFSQRYADPTDTLGFVIRQARLQDTKNRQNSVTLDLSDPPSRELQQIWEDHQRLVIQAAEKAYVWATTNGIAKEQARAVLPEGNTVSRMYINGTLRSWIHYIGVRDGHGTQAEHVDIARECAKVISDIFGNTVAPE